MSVVSRTAPGTEVATTSGGTSGKQKKPGSAPVLSASPRADLLPPEINDAIRRRSVRRGLRFVVVAAAVIGALGIAGAWQLSQGTQNALAQAKSQTQSLSTEKASYKDVALTIAGISAGKAAVRVGGSTDIDWSDYVSKLQSTLPAGVTLKTVGVKSADVTSSFEQSTIPLEGARIATVTFSADSATLPSIPDWIDGLSTLPGFADASPDSVTNSDTGYTASVTMHINTKAFSHRFAPATKEVVK